MEINRKYGIEIEIKKHSKMGRLITQAQIANAIRREGIRVQVEAYNHTTRSYWKVIYDISCGWEIVSPPLEGLDGFEQIKKVCKALNSLKAKVDRTCGLHVHIDANGLGKSEIEKIWIQFAKWEKAFDAMVPASRRNNHRYCDGLGIPFYSLIHNSLKRKDFKSNPAGYIRSIIGRYSKLNIVSYIVHGTIEFRQHSGTTDSEKIINWIIILEQFVNKSLEVKRVTYRQIKVKMTDFRWWLGLTRNAEGILGEASKWSLDRFQKLSPQATVDTIL